MTYETPGESSLDYLPCRYGSSRLLFRGPKRDLDAPYVAFMGGTETYGKFIASPFPAQIEKMLGLTCVNFGCANAGVDVFLNDTFMPEAARRAEVTVLQIAGAVNMSNRMYSVHPRRNDRFVAPSRALQSLYHDVDFAEFNFTRHLLSHLQDHCQARFDLIRAELQQAWTSRMLMLLDRLPGKKVLVWISAHPPCDDLQPPLDRDPAFVTRQMLDELEDEAEVLVEIVASPEAIQAETTGMVFSEMEYPAALEMLNPRVHEEVAVALLPVLQRLT